MRAFAGYLRSLDPQLPPAVWLLQAGGLANAFGNGFVVPFLVIYLHNVRGISLGIAGLVAASNSAAALVSGPVAGALADRVGPRATLVGALLVMTGAFALFPLIRSPWEAFALNTIAGIGSGAFWPSQSSLLTRLTPVVRRSAAFAQQRVTMNLGVGLGGLAGGLIARTSNPGSFTILFLLDAATFLVFVAVLVRVPSPPLERDESAAPATWTVVLRDRALVQFVLLNMVLLAAGIAVVVELFPAFAKNHAAVDERTIGLLWFLNTLVIVVAQLPVAKWLEGRRRMKALAWMGLVWALSLLLIEVGGATLDGTSAAAVFAIALVAFGVGECLHGAVQGPVVADLAPPRLVGRYMALSSSSWQLGFALGPAIGGFVLQHAPLALWPGAAAVCIAGSIWALALERRLPARVRVTPLSPREPQVLVPGEA